MAEVRVTKFGTYVETDVPAVLVTQAGAYVEMVRAGEVRVTQAGAYVEMNAPSVLVTQFGVYVETEEVEGGPWIAMIVG